METDPAEGSGWVSVREARTLARVAQQAAGGVDPHHLRLGAQKQSQGLGRHPGAGDGLVRIAELTDRCAVASWDGGRGVLMAGGRGHARWPLRHPRRMLSWPRPMAPDDHWVLLPPA